MTQDTARMLASLLMLSKKEAGERTTHILTNLLFQRDSHKAYKCYDLVELDTIFMDYDVIAIDEGQFFHNVKQKGGGGE